MRWKSWFEPFPTWMTGPKPSLATLLVRNMGKLPREQAHEMGRLVLLASQYLTEDLSPPLGTLEPDGEEC